MKNPFENPFARRVREDANKAAARDAVEQEIAEIEQKLAMFQHYSEQGEARLDDAQLRTELEEKLAAKRAELHDHPM
jgi:hypothetical protein